MKDVYTKLSDLQAFTNDEHNGMSPEVREHITWWLQEVQVDVIRANFETYRRAYRRGLKRGSNG